MLIEAVGIALVVIIMFVVGCVIALISVGFAFIMTKVFSSIRKQGRKTVHWKA